MVEVALRTVSGNVGHGREHWAARAKRVKVERNAVSHCWPWQLKKHEWAWPVLVRLVRIARRDIRDDDNLSAALKAVRDQVAAELGVDDGDKRYIRFLPARQERGVAGVRIELTELGRPV